MATDRIIIATGSDPHIPAISGLQKAGHWTNREATTLSELPASVAILGGGPVGVELGHLYARLGIQVTHPVGRSPRRSRGARPLASPPPTSPARTSEPTTRRFHACLLRPRDRRRRPDQHAGRRTRIDLATVAQFPTYTEGYLKGLEQLDLS